MDDDKKTRITCYVDNESEKLLNEIYAYKLIAGKKAIKSDIICDGIKLIYKKTFRRFKRKDNVNE